MKEKNRKVWWIDKAVWVMLVVYILGIVFMYLEGKESNMFLFLITMTLMFILGMLIAIAYMIAIKE